MSIERTLARAIATRVEARPAPVPDPVVVRAEARRATRRRRRTLAAVAVAGGVVLGAAVLVSGDDRGPVGLPAVGRLDLGDGVRGFVDPSDGTTYLGGVPVAAHLAPGLADTGMPTPHGVVYVTPSQEVRLIEESGRQRVLAPAAGQPTGGFRPSSAYDVRRDVVVWMTQEGPDRALVRAHGFEADRVVASTRIRLDGGGTSIGGADGGVVAVNVPDGVIEWDWTQTSGGRAAEDPRQGAFREMLSAGESVVDMRNGTALVADASGRTFEVLATLGFSGPRSQTWVYVEARADELLTLDGFHRLNGSAGLVPTGGARPLRLVVSGGPARAVYALDSDGSVLVGTGGTDSVAYYDCVLDGPWSACRALDRIATSGERPRLLGPSVRGVS